MRSESSPIWEYESGTALPQGCFQDIVPSTIRMAEKPADPERARVVIFENGEGEESVLEGSII